MKGYNSFKEYRDDYRLYLAAARIDPGRENGETITSFLKKRIDLKVKNSSKSFKKIIRKNHYNSEDLKIMATHDTIGEINQLKDFIRVCFGKNYAFSNYKKLISSESFKSGRLKKLYDFVPHSIKSKEDLLDFIRNNKMTHTELYSITNIICKGNWKSWKEELLNEGKIRIKRGYFCT